MASEKVVNFFLGLLVGEGCFLADLSYNPSKYKYNVAVTPSFKIQMSQDDTPMLAWLQDELGIGTIHINEGQEPHHDDMAVWQVYHTEEVRELVDLIESADCRAFRRSKKNDAYDRWSTIVEMKEPYKHFDSEKQVKELVRLSKQINDNDRGYSTEKWVGRVEGING